MAGMRRSTGRERIHEAQGGSCVGFTPPIGFATYNQCMNPRDRTDNCDEDESGDHYKTVYAHFGAAMYFAQCLEHGLVNALVYLDLIPNHPRPYRSPPPVGNRRSR